MLEKAVQVICGPQWNVTPQDVDAMLDYGLLCSEGERRLRSFNQTFGEYLRFIETSVETWPLWRDTERALRNAVRDLLQERFGPSWPDELARSRPKLAEILAACQDRMAKEQQRFGVGAVSDVLAYAYPLDLYRLMVADWHAIGEPLLGPDKMGWSSKFELLAKVRTPLAHNRDEGVGDGERLQAEGVCRELLGRISAWSRQRNITG